MPRERGKCRKGTREYSFRATTAGGEERRSILCAKNEQDAARLVKEQGLFPIQVWRGNRVMPSPMITRVLGRDYTMDEIIQAVLHWEQEGRP